MWNPKNKTNRLTDIENKLVVTIGERGRIGEGEGQDRVRGVRATKYYV